MNVLLRLAIVVGFSALGLSAALAAAAPVDSAAIEKEILRLDAARIEALLKNDVPALERLYADHLSYIHSNGRIDTKKGYLASLSGGNLSYVALRYDPAPRVTVAGRDTAFVTGKAHIDVKYKTGQLTQRVLTTTTVYVRAASGWQVVSYQGTPVP
jgi:ketosteroid isomerase-like protein